MAAAASAAVRQPSAVQPSSSAASSAAAAAITATTSPVPIAAARQSRRHLGAVDNVGSAAGLDEGLCTPEELAPSLHNAAGSLKQWHKRREFQKAVRRVQLGQYVCATANSAKRLRLARCGGFSPDCAFVALTLTLTLTLTHTIL